MFMLMFIFIFFGLTKSLYIITVFLQLSMQLQSIQASLNNISIISFLVGWQSCLPYANISLLVVYLLAAVKVGDKEVGDGIESR